MLTKEFSPEGRPDLIEKFMAVNRQNFDAFSRRMERENQLRNRLNLLRERVPSNQTKYEALSAQIGALTGPDLGKSCAENLIRLGDSPIKFNEILDSHCQAFFVSQNSSEILKELKTQLVDAPARELADFLKENKDEMRQLGIS